MSNITKLLSNNGFISCNKHLARLIGLHEALIIGEFCSLYDLYNGVEFYCPSERLQHETCLSEKQIRNALLHLQAAGIISITKKGQPCKNYYTLHTDKLESVIMTEEESKGKLEQQNLPNKDSNNCGTSSEESAPLLNNKILTNKILENNICETNSDFPELEDCPMPTNKKSTNVDLHTSKNHSSSKKSEQSFPEKDYSDCMTIYYKNRDELSKTQNVTSTIYNVKVYKKRLRQFFLQYGVEYTKRGISNSIRHSWIKKTDYSLNAVLAPTMFDDYIAGSIGTSNTKFNYTNPKRNISGISMNTNPENYDKDLW